MSYGAFVHASLAEKRSEVAARSARSGRAVDLIEEHLPEFVVDGCPCPWGVWAVLNLWLQHGEGNESVTRGAVRAERRRLLGRFKAQRGYDPYHPPKDGA
jgi:hypothetical protein